MGGYSLLTQEAQPSISNLGTMKKPAPVSALPSPSTCSNSCSPFFSSACPLTHGPPNPFLLLTFLSPILAASSPTSPFAPVPFSLSALPRYSPAFPICSLSVLSSAFDLELSEPCNHQIQHVHSSDLNPKDAQTSLGDSYCLTGDEVPASQIPGPAQTFGQQEHPGASRHGVHRGPAQSIGIPSGSVSLQVLRPPLC